MAERSSTIRRRRAIFREATAIIEAEYDRHLTVDSVARRVATSRRQLQRSFAEIGGTTFRSYLVVLRMQRAVELLHQGRASVREVAARVGYPQPSDFAKAFRRHHGIPPASARRSTRARRSSRPVIELEAQASALNRRSSSSGSAAIVR